MFNKVTFKLNTQALVNGIDMVVVLLSTYTGPAVFVKMSAVNSAEICQLTSPHSPAPLPPPPVLSNDNCTGNNNQICYNNIVVFTL